MRHDKTFWRSLWDGWLGDDSPESRALRSEQAGVLSRGTPTMALGNLLNSAVTAAVLFQTASLLVLGPWLGLVWLLAGDRLIRWRRNRRRSHEGPVRKRTLVRSVVWSGLAGAIWGALGIVLVPAVPGAYQVFIAFVIGGQAAAAATWLVALFPAFLAYLIASMAPLIVGFLLQKTFLGFAMAAMLVAYSAVQVHFGLQGARSLRYRVRAEQERQRLTEALRASRDGIEREVASRTVELGRANAQLSGEIAERSRVEAELRTSQRLLQTVFDTIPATLSVKDAQGRYVLANSVLATMYRCRPEDLVGKLPHEIPGIDPEAARTIARDDRRVLDTGRSKETPRFTVTLPNGQKRIRRALRTPIVDEQGRVTGLVMLAEDFTARVEFEEKLAAGQRLLQTIIDTIPHFIFVKDTESRYILANKHLADAVGLKPEQMVGMLSWHLPGAKLDTVESAMAEDRQVLTSGKPVVTEPEPGRVRGLEQRWLRTMKLPLRDDAGRVVGLVGLAEDVTEHHFAEQRVKDSQRLLQSVIDTIPHAVFAKDRETRYMLANKHTASLVGLTPEQMIGLQSKDLAGALPEAVEQALAEDREVLTKGIPVIREAVPGRVASAANRWRRYIKLPLRDESGRVMGVVGVAEDITDRYLAERDLRESRQLLQTVFDALPVWVFVKDRQRRTVMINRRMAIDYGLDPGAAPPADLSANLPEDARERIAGYDFQVLNGGEPLEVPEMTVALPGQKPRVMRVMRMPLRNSEGSVVGVVGVLQDISEREHAADALLQMQKLESLGALAGGIAHNFNNLLTGILGHVELVMHEENLPADVREALQIVQTSGRKAAALAEQMLAYSGRGHYQVGPVSANDLVEGMLPLLSVAVPKGVNLNLRFGDGLPQITADSSQLRQLIVNVVTNAGEAIGSGAGEITLATGSVKLSRQALAGYHLGADLPEGEYVFIDVTDTGAGMTEKVLQRIFDPFFTTRLSGRGLGLAAALGIVRGHDGAIRVVSAPGMGTTVRILLPAIEGPAEETAPAPQPVKGTGTVLVVDDDPVVRRLTATMLGELGMGVIEAESGDEAVRMLRKHSAVVEWALIDASIPGMDGPNTLRALRRVAPELPALVVSGQAEPELWERFDGLNVRGILRKPFTLADLEIHLARRPGPQLRAGA